MKDEYGSWIGRRLKIVGRSFSTVIPTESAAAASAAFRDYVSAVLLGLVGMGCHHERRRQQTPIVMRTRDMSALECSSTSNSTDMHSTGRIGSYSDKNDFLKHDSSV